MEEDGIVTSETARGSPVQEEVETTDEVKETEE